MDFNIRDNEELRKKGALHWRRVTASEWFLFFGVWIVSLYTLVAASSANVRLIGGFGVVFFGLPFLFIIYQSLRYTEDTATEIEKMSSQNQQPSKRGQPTDLIKNRARKNTTVAILLGIFVSPAAYVYVGKWGWAAANFFTLNFLLLGVFIVPIHTYKSIKAAQQEVQEWDEAGEPD